MRERQETLMKLHLGGHLSWYVAPKRSWVEIPLSAPTTLGAVLKTLGVPTEEIAVGAVNGAAIFSFEELRVTDEDRVELFPPVGGGTPARKFAKRHLAEISAKRGSAKSAAGRFQVGAQ
jgi:sulfur carrier protein ThiS